MSKLLKIGNYKVKDNIKQFFYDGCHKIYLIEDDSDIAMMFENGWEKTDIYDIAELEDVFQWACPLRFISTCKLKTIVPQLRKITKFTYDNHISYNKF